MLIVTGYLDFPDVDRDEVLRGLADVTERSRQDPGCIDYWWAEDAVRPKRFRFFECWETERHFEIHRTQPFEAEFMDRFVSRCSGARAHTYTASERKPAS